MFVAESLCGDCGDGVEKFTQSSTDNLFYTKAKQRVDEVLNMETTKHTGWRKWSESLDLVDFATVKFMLPDSSATDVAVQTGKPMSEAAKHVTFEDVDMNTINFIKCHSDQSASDVIGHENKVWSDMCVILCHKVKLIGDVEGEWFVEHLQPILSNKHLSQMAADVTSHKQLWHNAADDTIVDSRTVVDGDMVVRVTSLLAVSSSSPGEQSEQQSSSRPAPKQQSPSESSAHTMSSSSSFNSRASSTHSGSSTSSSNISGSASSNSSQAPGFKVVVILEDPALIANFTEGDIAMVLESFVDNVAGTFVVEIEKDMDSSVKVVVTTQSEETARKVVTTIKEEQHKGEACKAGIFCRAVVNQIDSASSMQPDCAKCKLSQTHLMMLSALLFIYGLATLSH